MIESLTPGAMSFLILSCSVLSTPFRHRVGALHLEARRARIGAGFMFGALHGELR